MPFHAKSYHLKPFNSTPYHQIPPNSNFTIPCHTIPSSTISYHTNSSLTIPYHIIPSYTIKCHSISWFKIRPYFLVYSTMSNLWFIHNLIKASTILPQSRNRKNKIWVLWFLFPFFKCYINYLLSYFPSSAHGFTWPASDL